MSLTLLVVTCSHFRSLICLRQSENIVGIGNTGWPNLLCVSLDEQVSLKSGIPYGIAVWYEDLPPPLLQVSQLPEKALLGQEELCHLSMELRDLMWYLCYIPANSGKLVNPRKDTSQSLTYAPNLNLPTQPEPSHCLSWVLSQYL